MVSQSSNHHLQLLQISQELAELRACVQALQVERDVLRAEVARQNVEGRPRNARSLAVPSPDLVMGDNSVQSHSVLAIRSGRNPSSVMETLIDQADSSVKSNHRFNPCVWAYIKMSGIYSILNFGHFCSPLFSLCFYPF